MNTYLPFPRIAVSSEITVGLRTLFLFVFAFGLSATISAQAKLPAEIRIDAASLAATYDGSAKPVTVTTVPEGLLVEVTYDGSAQAPADAGTYAVAATINDANYEGFANETLAIAKATASVTLGDLSQTYDGAEKPVSVTTTPEGLLVEVTYDGNGQAPVNAGTYAVAAMINDANYEGGDSGILSIGKATATVTIGDLSQTYDGSAKRVSATTTPEGLSVVLTYDGSEVEPINAGNYTVAATINDANYEGGDSGMLSIAKATATVTLGDLSQTYDGAEKPVSVTTVPEGLLVDVTYDGSAQAPANAGTYAVAATINDANYEGGDSGILSIGKATATVTIGDLSQTYDGSAKRVSATTTPEGLSVVLTYDGSEVEPINAGNYTVAAMINDANYEGGDSGMLSIAKATATVTLGDLSQTYDGAEKPVSVTTTPEGLLVDVAYDGSAQAPVNAGTYAVAASINDANYEGGDSGTLSIAKATATVTLGDLSQTYDGSAKRASVTTTPEGLSVSLTYDGSETEPINAGTYAVAATINDANYEGGDSGMLSIAKATATVTLGDLTQTYDGAEKPVSVTTTPEGLLVDVAYDGSAQAPVNAGTYAVAASINDANYEGGDSGTLSIGKATASVTLSGLSQTYDGGSKRASVTTTPEGLSVSLTYDGSETEPINAGTYAVAAAVNDANYNGSGAGTLEIAKGVQSINFAAIPDQTLGTAPLSLNATSNSGLVPTFSVVSGPAFVSGSQLTMQGIGNVVVRVTQAGDVNWQAASADRSFRVVAGDFAQSYVWASGFGGTGYDTAYAVAPESGGGAYLAGDFEDAVTFGSSTFTVAGGGLSDLVVLKVDWQGSVLWARQYGGANSDFAKAVVALPSGGMVVGSEFTTSTAIGGATLNSAGSRDIALFKVNDDGTFAWAKRFGGASSDSLHSVAVDASGNIYLAGQFSGSITFGSNATLTSSGSSDGFVAKLDADGVPVWSRRMGGTGADIAYAVAVKSDGSVGVAGSFNGGATFGSYTLSSAGASDGFAALIDGAGTFQWAKRFGGTTADSARSAAFDDTGDLWVSGSFTGSAASGFGVSNLTSAGAEDVFVMRLVSSNGAHGEAYRFGGTGSETALSLSTDPYGSVVLGGSFQGQVAFGSTNLLCAGLSDTFVAKIRAGRGAVWALRGGGINDDRSQSVAVNSYGEIFHAGLFSTQAAFGSSSVSGGGFWDLFVAKINGPFPTFTGLPATLNVDEGDPLTLNATVLGAEPVSLQWYKDGQPIDGATSAILSLTEASPADGGEYYLEGTNAYGTWFSAAVLVTVRVPDQVVSLEAVPATEENRTLEAPVYLESAGDVSGITIVISYDKVYLSNAAFVLGPHFVDGNSSVVVDKNAGTVRVVGNAFPSTVPDGRHLLGTFRATTRSVPVNTSVSLLPSLSSISDVFGRPIEGYTKINGASVSIAQRNVPGDANNNGRLDVADAAELIRLYGNPSLIRTWDNYLNDLNGDGILTEGDAIRVLRVAAALDSMPVFPSAAPASLRVRSSKTLSSVEAPAPLAVSSTSRTRTVTSSSSASARLVLTRLTGSNANKVMAQVFVDGLPSGQAGLSFTVNYPAALLRISGSQALVTPAGGLPAEATRIWNPEQTGTVTLAAANASPFGFDPTQPVANIVFDVQPAATAQVHFPVTLTAVEASPFNAEGPASPVSLAGQTAVFSRTYADWASANLGDAAASSSSDSDGDGQSNGAEFAASTDPADAFSLLRTTSMERALGGFTVRWLAAYGVNYRLSASTDLKIWSPAGGIITGEGVETSATDSSSASSARKFYRVEVVSP